MWKKVVNTWNFEMYEDGMLEVMLWLTSPHHHSSSRLKAWHVLSFSCQTYWSSSVYHSRSARLIYRSFLVTEHCLIYIYIKQFRGRLLERCTLSVYFLCRWMWWVLQPVVWDDLSRHHLPCCIHICMYDACMCGQTHARTCAHTHTHTRTHARPLLIHCTL